MTKFIFFLYFITTSASAADQFRLNVKEIKATQLERAYILNGDSTETLLFDCQSFIQGITVRGNFEDRLFYIDSNRCEEYLLKVIELFQKSNHLCLKLDFELEEITYSAGTLDCRDSEESFNSGALFKFKSKDSLTSFDLGSLPTKSLIK